MPRELGRLGGQAFAGPEPDPSRDFYGALSQHAAKAGD